MPAADLRAHRFPALSMDDEGKLGEDTTCMDAGYLVRLAERIEWLRNRSHGLKGPPLKRLHRRLKRSLAAYDALHALFEP